MIRIEKENKLSYMVTPVHTPEQQKRELVYNVFGTLNGVF